MYDKILVPYDGTPSSKMAFNSALSLAKKHESKILVFTCIPEQATFGLFKTKSDKKAIQHQKKLAEKQISSLEEKAIKKGVPLSSKIITSSSLPSKCIVNFAKNQKIDLIVVSPSKILPLEKRYYHSTVENLYKNSPCALLIIK